MTRYCPDCGTGHDCEAEAVVTAIDREIEIERLRTKRDIEVARISAGVQRDELETAESIAETQAEAEVISAVAEAEILGDAIEGGIQDAPEPLIIDAPGPPPDDTAADAPPEIEGSEPPEPARKTVGLGMW